MHARKAVLGGLSPKDNREVPPLRFDVVQRVKESFPALPVIVNGGMRDGGRRLAALTWCDGVMFGREAYHRPYVLAELHEAMHSGAAAAPTRAALLERMRRYAERELAAGGRLRRSSGTCWGCDARGARRTRIPPHPQRGRAAGRGAPGAAAPGDAKPDPGKVASGLKTLAYNPAQAYG